MRVVPQPAVTEPDVQVAIGAEDELAAGVILIGPLEVEQNARQRRGLSAEICWRHMPLADARVDLLGMHRDVVRVEQAVVCEARMEGEAEQTTVVQRSDVADEQIRTELCTCRR